MENYVVLAAGIWLIFGSLLLDTSNVRSTMFFKVIPFFLGAGASVVAMKTLTWI